MGPTEDWKDNIEYMAELFPAPIEAWVVSYKVLRKLKNEGYYFPAPIKVWVGSYQSNEKWKIRQRTKFPTPLDAWVVSYRKRYYGIH